MAIPPRLDFGGIECAVLVNMARRISTALQLIHRVVNNRRVFSFDMRCLLGSKSRLMAPSAGRFKPRRLPIGRRRTADMATGTSHVGVMVARIACRRMRKHSSGPHRGAHVANTAIGSRYQMALGLGRRTMAGIAAAGDVGVVEFRPRKRCCGMAGVTVGSRRRVVFGLAGGGGSVMANVATPGDVVVKALRTLPRPRAMAIVTRV